MRASFFTALVVWIVNRPIAVEALRADEIGRTFLPPFVVARNPALLVYAGLAEATLFVAVPTHREIVFAATAGFIGAALGTERAMRASLGPRTRATYAALGRALAALGLAVVAVSLTRATVDPKHASGALEALVTTADLLAMMGFCTFFILDACFAVPPVARAFGARFARRRG